VSCVYWCYVFLRGACCVLLLTVLVFVAPLMIAFMVCWTLWVSLVFLFLLSLLLPAFLILFIASTFKRPVSSWKALNLRKTLLRSEERRVGKECRLEWMTESILHKIIQKKK